MASSTGSTSNILGPNGTSNFMSGLASGLDTEDMVEKLLSGTQAKIDKQNAKKQQVEWKQEIYRDMITKINGFQDKYFSFFGTGNTNLLSSSFYNVMTAASTSSAVKVTSATSKAPSNMVINSISQLATASRGESIGKVTGRLQGSITSGAFEAGKTYSFDMTLDGVRKTIKFEGAASQADLIDNMNQAMEKVYGDTVKFDSNMNLTFKSIPGSGGTANPIEDDSHRVVLYNTADNSDETVIKENVLQNLGIKSGASNKLDYNTYLNDIPFKTKLQGRNFTFKINGTEIKASSEDTLGDLINRINNSEAEVKVTYSSVTDKFIIESANTGAGIDITMEQSEGNILSAMFGFEGGDAVTGTAKGLLLRNETLDPGDGTTNAVKKVTSGKTDLDAYLENSDKKAQTLSFYLTDPSGKEQKYSITVPAKKYADESALAEEINKQLKDKFKTVKLAGSDTEVPVLELEIDGGEAKLKVVQVNDDGEAVMNSADASAPNYGIRFTADNEDTTLSGMLGFTKYDANTKLSDLGLTGKIEIYRNSTGDKKEINLDRLSIGELANKLGYGTERPVSFNSTTGRITIEEGLGAVTISGSDANGNNAMNALFGTTRLEKNGGITTEEFKENRVTAGKNAILTVNGTTDSNGNVVGATTIERNTNTFELDGITMELTATTAAGDPPISLTTSKDTDKIVEGLKGFVDDYNALIEELNKQVNAEASYQKYPPLTDAQKKEMSEREIEKWEEKSKEGLLRYDSNITKFLQDMRSVMYKTVESAGLALYDIGIESSSNYRDNGKLVLDESKLKSALTTNLDGIQKLFTDKENGIAVQLQSTIKAAANPSSGSPGSLVRYAGTKDVMVTSNSLYYELKSISEALSRLNTKYETERTRYWKQFTSMEQAISKMNSQSSWLTQQFS